MIETDQLPTIDDVGGRWLVHRCHERDVRLTPAITHFLASAVLDGRHPVLLTREDAVLSPLLLVEVNRLAVGWAALRPDGVLLDAYTGHEVRHMDQLVDGVPGPASSLLRHARTRDRLAAIGFSIEVHHRASAETVLGGVAEALVASLERRPLAAMGHSEPLLQRWDRARLTRAAQQQMPRADLVRAWSPDGVWFCLDAERNPHGVTERLTGRAVLGGWSTWAPQAPTIARGLLEAIAGEASIVSATTSLMDVDADGGQGVRMRHPEEPLAYLAGPVTLRRFGLDAAEAAGRFGLQQIGRARVGSALAVFDPAKGDPTQQMRQLVWGLAEVGAERQEARRGN